MAPTAVDVDVTAESTVSKKMAHANGHHVLQLDQRSSATRVDTDPSARIAKSATLQLNDLVINGFKSQGDKVANFRGIQYATIQGRWHQAQPIDLNMISGSIDATQWGARCPQPVDVLHDATSHLYPRMATFDRQSEFECLNLNIYTPTDALGHEKLSVLVWIHGGAFIYGDGGCEFGMSVGYLSNYSAVS